MKLPFRYQFILAPFVIVVLLACLVAYTLFELANINHENEVTRQWELVTDRIQTSITGAIRLNKVIDELSSAKDIEQDEQFFSYLEQTRIVSDSLLDPTLLGQVSAGLRQQIKDSEQLLREPERVKPEVVSLSLNNLLPALEYQYKIFAAQRRTTFIDNHRQLVTISSRMTTALLTGLIFCIVLAAGLALWGLSVNRRRLNNLSQRAHAVCSGDNAPLAAPESALDELDDLEICLANMTTRLLNVVSVENVLHGVEHERRRIAMDMHDGVLADLTAINRRLDSLNINVMNTDEIKTLRADVDDIISHLRCTIDDLHPQVLETLGLESALHSFLNRHSTATGFPQVHFEYDEKIENALLMEQKINLFRIVTEAINNVIKHAHCDRFEVGLRLVAQQLIVTVEDNGVGMPEKYNASGHGCANISERARLIGATVQWRASRFASGTCFELTLPLNRSKK